MSKPLINEDGEVREITAQDMADFKPAAEVLSPAVFAMLSAPRKPRGANKAPTKTQVTLRLDKDVITAFKATGKGWQTRINDVLRREIAQNSH